jgi:phosphoribosyl-AMP cyclohydrolase
MLTPKYDERGLIPAIVQDADTGQVLMLAWMNDVSLQWTLRTGETHFWSRSRQQIWHKGATSGNIQHIVEISLDCDLDTILLRVRPAGPACHTGAISCFFNRVEQEKQSD